MKTERIVVLIILLLLLVLTGGLIGLAHAPMMPQKQTIDQAIPDAHIPR